MNTIRRLGILWLITAITLSFAACSSDDDPVIEEEEETFIEGKLPKNLHVGMLYPISHDKKNDKCTFGLYLGDNPQQDFIDALEQGRVTLAMYDRNGNKYERNYWDSNGFNVYDSTLGFKLSHDRTITMSCAFCEIYTKFCIQYSKPTIFEFYPELTKMDDVELNFVSWPGNPLDGTLINGNIIQSWSSPHHWYF